MCQRALSSAIKQNTALGNATQYNIQVFAPHIGNAIRELNDGTDLTSEQAVVVLDFLKTMADLNLFSLIPPQKGNRIKSSNDLDSHETIGAELCSPGLLRTCFPALAGFRDDWLRSIQDYCQYSSSAIQLLHHKKLKSIANWLSSPSPEILLIDINDEPGDSSWTTDLVLEMVGVFEAATVVSKGIRSAIITHFCRRNVARQSYSEAILLQDFLVQIIEAYPEKFKDSRECQQDGLTETNLCSAADNPEDLWDLIVRCIKRTRIRMLVIMLDHIEEMFLRNLGTNDRDGFQNFVEKLQTNIDVLHKEHRIVVKTMVTCRLDTAAFYFYEVGATAIAMPNPPRRLFLTGD
ncbi:hypothetical protein O1611_g3128 [Lasiodiplodia mahajangana]|uniref:Uncharacterized protein n=1 Tax=Lasiodiplodia mahajangana TaxID=1108764 RepID=A0ACC2JSW5_9PEZI|nr:hypothetical protein O1611_g3128 [Lasiodiplodia mahajangana]